MKHRVAARRSTVSHNRTFLSRLLPLGLLAGMLSCAALPAAAQTLAANSREGAAPAFAAATSSHDSETAPNAVSANSAIDPATGAPVSLGALNIDLAQVRRVKVAGVSIEDAPMRVGNLDVLAPIIGEGSRILSGLGATASQAAEGNAGNPNTPTEEQIFQINLPSGSPIILTVGKASAIVNSTEQTLRAAPLVMNGKIWLPIFSLAPLLGASVRLQPDGTLHVNPTVQSVELFPANGYTVLTVKLSAPLKDKAPMGSMDGPPKLYLDFRGYAMGFDALYSTNERVASAGLNEVEKVRVGMPEKFPGTTRVALDLKKDMTGIYQPLPDKTIYALLLVKPGLDGARVMTAPSAALVTNVTPGRGSLRGLTIVVDAGHGGHDSGAPGAKSYEKNHTLDIAKRLRNHLVARGATVLMSRDTDNFISLQGRVDFANSHNADIFFSVHIDSFRATSGGTSTHFWTAQSAALAREVQSQLAAATGLTNRGVKQSKFYVIRKTSMPSVLTETCFISNPREEALLLKPEWRDKVARGMAQGILNYAQKYKLRGSVNQ